jgi:response regulator of citrate/malate metabolism
MAHGTVKDLVFLAQKNFNNNTYLRFIKPLIEAVRDEALLEVNNRLKKAVSDFSTNVSSRAESRKEELSDGITYITIEELSKILFEEKSKL